ncbi:MAG: response regulator transcription factor [Acidobacteriota bacterium]|jgi:DNA-binding NarL/FixJ family response regulator
MRIVSDSSFPEYEGWGIPPMTEVYRIVLADDHSIIRNEVRSVLELSPNFQIIGEACDGQDLLRLLGLGVIPDVLITDLIMPQMSGIEALQNIRKMGFEFKILVLTMRNEPDFPCRSFAVGANGYMLKDAVAKELPGALAAVLADIVYLSPAMRKRMPDCCRVPQSAVSNSSSAVIAHCGKSSIQDIL